MRKTAEGELLNNSASNYDKDAYEKPSVTVDVAVCTVFKGKLQVRLIQRARNPHKGAWAIPGGFVDVPAKETLEETAARELREETGIEDIYLEQLKTYGDPNRDPRMRIITVAYFALIPYSVIRKQKMLESGEEGITKWFPLTKLPKKLAFDHEQILKDLLERLRGKVSYTPIIFSLVPDVFTFPELQEAYETVLGQDYSRANFRRMIELRYELQKEQKRPPRRPGRPADYFRFVGVLNS